MGDNSTKKINISAFTSKWQGLVNTIITDSFVSLPFNPQIPQNGKPPIQYPVKAIWDTGATNSSITAKTVSDLGLKPISMTKVHHANGSSMHYVYLVNIYLPNHVAIYDVKVTEIPISDSNFGILIGMDIISLGDFSLSAFEGKTSLSFRIPSVANIDYVKDINSLQHHEPGRNALCPCGSGLKYKKCHGK
jgi:hypothetical protein